MNLHPLRLTLLLSIVIIPLIAMRDPNDPNEQLWQLFSTHKSHQTSYATLQSNVQKLIQAGADLNKRDYSWPSVTPGADNLLTYAIRRLNPDLCKVLLENGADIIASGTLTYTPLIAVAEAARFRRKKGYRVCLVLIKHMIMRQRAAQMASIKTLILCLTRMGKTDYRMRDFVRKGAVLLKPYCMANVASNCREMLEEELSKRDYSPNRNRAWGLYKCPLLDPARVDDTIQTVLLEMKLQAEIDNQ